MQHLLKQMGIAAGLTTKIEQNPTTNVQSGIKPADVLFEDFDSDGSLATDVTIISPFRQGSLAAASRTFLATAENAFIQKMHKYDKCIFKPNCYFKPFVIEEFGAMHKESSLIFNRLCAFIANRQDKDVTEVKFHYSKLLSAIIQRQNSRAILARKV